MSLKSKMFLKVGVVILAITVFLFVFFRFFSQIKFDFKNEKKDIEIKKNYNNPGGLSNNLKKENKNRNMSTQPNAPSSRTSSLPKEVSLKNLAIFVAERLGSYSTDTVNFSNLKDIEYLMTEKMKTWMRQTINQSRRSPSLDYYGVATRALSVKIKDNSQSQDSQIVEVFCQREESFGKDNLNTRIKYQNLKIKFIKKGDNWLVDEVAWE